MTQVDSAEAANLPQRAVRVNRRVWFRDVYGNRAVFVDQTPFYVYPVEDEFANRLCAVQLAEAGIVSAKQLCQAFRFNERTFCRMRSRFRKNGIAGLARKKVGRKSKQTPTLATGIVLLYLDGYSTYFIANKLGVSPATVRRILKNKGVELRSPYDRPTPGLLKNRNGLQRHKSNHELSD